MQFLYKAKGVPIGRMYYIAPAFLNIDTRWRRVVSFTLRPSYPLWSSLCSHRIVGSVCSRSSVNNLEAKLISCYCPELKPRPPQHPSHRPTQYADRARPDPILLRIIIICINHDETENVFAETSVHV